MFFLFLALPILPYLLIHIVAAVLPAFLLLRYIYRHDTVEKEPPRLLGLLLLMGVLSALIAGVLESIGLIPLNMAVSSDSTVYTVLLAFLVVAVAEEGAKYLLLRRTTWKHPAFNYRFDGIVYAVFVSLGFAAFENVQYVFNYGLSVALPRALLAVPGHMSFAVFMGLYYGRARLCENYGDSAAARRNLWTGFLMAVALHGFYDACAMIGTTGSTLIFVVFVLLMFFLAYRTVKRESATDSEL